MDDSGFEGFYRESRDQCFRALVVAVSDAGEAEDLLAEAYARALERWSEVRSHPAPRAWVLTVALNLKRDRWRRGRLKVRHLMGLVPATNPELPVEPRLLTAVSELPEQQRRVLALRVMLDLDTAQTAEILGIAPGTVTTHLHRALAALREVITKEEVC